MNDILFLIVLFISNTIQTVTGFAGSLLSVPAGIKLVGYENAVVIVNAFTFLSCPYIAVRNFRDVKLKELVLMVSFMLIGMSAGTLASGMVSGRFLKNIYGAMIILIACNKLFIKKEFEFPNWLMLITLIAAGFIHELFASGGALLVIYASVSLKDKRRFRATVSSVWVVLNLILAIQHFASSMYSEYNISLLALSLIPMIFSAIAGSVLFEKISKKAFFNGTYVLLIISGAAVFV